MNRLTVNRSLKSALVVAAAAYAALGAGIAQASDDQVLDACIQEFIASNLSGYQGNISVHKLPAAEQLVPLRATHHSQVVVSAARAHGAELASAVCEVGHDGKVISMTMTSGAQKLSKAIAPIVVAESK